MQLSKENSKYICIPFSVHSHCLPDQRSFAMNLRDLTRMGASNSLLLRCILGTCQKLNNYIKA